MRLTASMAVSNKASTIAFPGLRVPCRPRRATLGGRGRLSALLRPPRGAAAQGQVDRVHAPRRQAHGRVRQQRRDGGGQREVRRRRRGGLQDAPPHLGQVSEHFVVHLERAWVWLEKGLENWREMWLRLRLRFSMYTGNSPKWDVYTLTSMTYHRIKRSIMKPYMRPIFPPVIGPPLHTGHNGVTEVSHLVTSVHTLATGRWTRRACRSA